MEVGLCMYKEVIGNDNLNNEKNQKKLNVQHAIYPYLKLIKSLVIFILTIRKELIEIDERKKRARHDDFEMIIMNI